MADILNLTLKKDVYESIKHFTSNEILLDKTTYWEKRLMDKSGGFRKYDVVRISSGSPEKTDYLIESIALKGKKFIITVGQNSVTENTEEPEAPAPVKELTLEEINEILKKGFEENIEKQEEDEEELPISNPIVLPTAQSIIFKEPQVSKKETKTQSVNDRIKKLVLEFCNRKNVYTITKTDLLTIKNNGRILGTNYNLNIKSDYDIVISPAKFEFVREHWMDDDTYYNYIKDAFDDFLNGNVVFIWKNKCVFSKVDSGEDNFIVTLAKKKAFLFNRH